jgi:imidazolonepropionase-like amidohydrolase
MKIRFTRLWLIISLLLVVSCSKASPDLHTSGQNKKSAISGHITAIKHVNLVPMTVEKIFEKQTVLVEGTRIIAFGPANEVAIPEDAKVIEGAGAYLMPNEGNLVGPTLYTSGIMLGHPSAGPVQDPQKIVQENKAQGFDFLKLYSFLSKEEFHQAMTTAKQLGMYTTGHIPFSVGIDGVLAEGMDEIAHIEELDFEFLDFNRGKNLQPNEWFIYIIDAAVQQYRASFGLNIADLKKRYGETIAVTVNKLKSANVPICTTLVVGEIIVEKLFKTEAFLARPENKYLPRWYMDAFRQGKEKHHVQFRGHEDLAPFKYKLERLLLTASKQAGILLLLSTDAGSGGMGIVPGFSIHDELRILTENGFTPYEAIATGTTNASKVVAVMTGEDDFGTIGVGKRADLILLKGNPLEDVNNIQGILGVMAAGKWYGKAELQKMIAISGQ